MRNEQSRLYRKKNNTPVTAVQLNLDTDGFSSLKWGGKQRCSRGDWLINSDDSCYTIANRSFKRTYREQSPGRYIKHTLVRATRATASGKIPTHEGETTYAAGDYLIENDEEGTDTYAIREDRFHKLYELADESSE